MNNKIMVIIVTLLALNQAVFAADAEVIVSKEQHSPIVNAAKLDLNPPLNTQTTSRSRIRRTPDSKGIAYRILEKDEKIKVLGSKDGWVRVESKWKNEFGKPLVGYIWGGDIPKNVAEKAGVRFDHAPNSDKSALNVENQPAAARTISVLVPEIIPAVDIKPIEAARDALAVELKTSRSEIEKLKDALLKSEKETKPLQLAKASLETQVKSLQSEVDKMKTDISKRLVEIKGLQAALSSSDSKNKQFEEERLKVVSEAQSLKTQLATSNVELQVLRGGGMQKLVVLADNGESVYFKGVGEAKMAAAEGKSVIRFPLLATNKADKALIGAKAEKHINGSFVYYILNSAVLTY